MNSGLVELTLLVQRLDPFLRLAIIARRGRFLRDLARDRGQNFPDLVLIFWRCVREQTCPYRFGRLQ